MNDSQGSPEERFRQHYFDRDHDEFVAMVAPGLAGPDYTGAKVGARLQAPFADEYEIIVLFKGYTRVRVKFSGNRGLVVHIARCPKQDMAVPGVDILIAVRKRQRVAARVLVKFSDSPQLTAKVTHV